jgi:hypothetical protein
MATGESYCPARGPYAALLSPGCRYATHVVPGLEMRAIVAGCIHPCQVSAGQSRVRAAA